MAPVSNFFQNFINFVKIDPLIWKIWEFEFWKEPLFPPNNQIFKVCILKTICRISVEIDFSSLKQPINQISCESVVVK